MTSNVSLQFAVGGCCQQSCNCSQRRIQCFSESRCVKLSFKILPLHPSVTFKDPGYLALSTAAAISQVGEQPAGRFRDLFLPNGQALSPGSYLRMPGVADVMEAGLFSFYHGNISQELEDEVVHR